MKLPKYKFYPSLLDAFQTFLDCEAHYERFYGHSENPSLTYAEYERKAFQELIDKINRVPFDSEAADKGTCFNEIVDCILLGQKSTRDDVRLTTRKILTFNKVMRRVEGHKTIDEDVEPYEIYFPHIEAVKGERTFYFSINLCRRAAEHFKGAIPQLYTAAEIQTRYGSVLLYGYIDYLREDVVYDAKTTKKYEFGKYQKYWQQHVYPWTLIESGKCTNIRAFEFTAFRLKDKGDKFPIITGDMYPEVYMYDHQRSTHLLVQMCERFIEFIENNKSLITDNKVFGGTKE